MQPQVPAQHSAFRIHTLESAPEQSRPGLQGLTQAIGFLPNVAATMAESPALLGAFLGGFGAFHGSAFDEREKQVILLTNAVTMNCPWTVAFHSTIALKVGVATAEIEAIRGGGVPIDAKYAALSRLARGLIESRGKLEGADLAMFTAAGYSSRQALEVIAAIGISTMAATVGNLARTPVEVPLQANAWSGSEG
jgi:alkylhydroperoxidase family enzyme